MSGALNARHRFASAPLSLSKGSPLAPTIKRGGLALTQPPQTATASASPELAQIWREFKRTGCDALRNRLIIHYMGGHVRRLAGRLRSQLPPQVDVEDLIDESYEGLVHAINNFDPEKDVRFETFSSKRLFGAMRDYLRRIDPAPRLARTRFKQATALIDGFQTRHGRPPEHEELRRMLRQSALVRFRRKLQREPDELERAKLMKTADATFRKTMLEGKPALMVSYNGDGRQMNSDALDADAMSNFEDRRIWGDAGQHSAVSGPLTRAELSDLRRWITQGFSRRDRLIIILYYYEQMTMKEIGATIGCSESRVSQRLVSILKCLRSRLQRTGRETEFYCK